MPRFLEPLKAVLTEEGAVNLECKVIGVPQPTLSWYKDGVELKQGDIHRLMSGKDGSCCLGTYTCVADNCMGTVTSSAALLGFEVTPVVEEQALATDLQTPDISDGNIKPFSLSIIQEERTSQMMSPEAALTEHTLRQHSLEQDQEEELSQKSLEKSIISVGKLDVDGELSLSIGDKEVTLSLYQTPDLSEKDAQNICEMFADEIAESISENKFVELPPLRFTKETAKASNINMEAIVIDIDRQDLEEYESMQAALENVDDLQTECDIEDCSVAEWNEEPVKGTEFETFACEEIMELDDKKVDGASPDEPIEPIVTNDKFEYESDTIKRAPKKDKSKSEVEADSAQLVKVSEVLLREEVNTEDKKLDEIKNVTPIKQKTPEVTTTITNQKDTVNEKNVSTDANAIKEQERSKKGRDEIPESKEVSEETQKLKKGDDDDKKTDDIVIEHSLTDKNEDVGCPDIVDVKKQPPEVGESGKEANIVKAVQEVNTAPADASSTVNTGDNKSEKVTVEQAKEVIMKEKESVTTEMKEKESVTTEMEEKESVTTETKETKGPTEESNLSPPDTNEKTNTEAKF